MRKWTFTQADPICTHLSADPRAIPLNLEDDQTWTLSLTGEDPAAIHLRTTYGRRAHRMHLYPHFGWDDEVLGDPGRFYAPPHITALTPDYIRLAFEPLEGLEASAEFLIADSSTLLGRIVLTNHTLESHQARVKLYIDLLSVEDDGGMRKKVFKGGSVLTGSTGGLEPVLAVCSGAIVQESAHPALVVRDRLDPDRSRSWRFAMVAKTDFHASVLHAREQCGIDWEAALARLEQRSARMLDIETGDPAWDAALWMTQKETFRHLVSPTRSLPAMGFVSQRVPDGRLSSAPGTEADSQTMPDSAEAYWMASQLLESDPELALGVVHNYLSSQDPDGFTDGRPGLKGERSGEMCIPLLADLTWKVYQRTEDDDQLRELFPGLYTYFEAWFSERNDVDQDGVPEWRSTFQAGFDHWPSFARWQKWGQGLKISRAETIDLASYLYREAVVLEAMADLVGTPEQREKIHARRECLHEAVESTWSDRASVYHHRDRDDHVSPRGKRLARGKGPYKNEVEGRYDDPVRLVVRARCKEAIGKSIEVLIHGRGKRGRPRVERLKASDFDWFWDYGVATTDKTYVVLSEIEVRGISDRCSTEISIADLSREDQAALLPLWAGIPDPARGERLVEKTILDETRFWRSAGIPRCSAKDKNFDPTEKRGCGSVSMLWSSMVGEGLVDYGYLNEAAVLLERLMRNAIDALKVDNCYRRQYNVDEGFGIGDVCSLAGAAPLSLFLRIAGVRLFSPRKVWVRGHHPLPWPITLKWLGLELRLESAGVTATFPDGQTQTWTPSEPMLIEQVD